MYRIVSEIFTNILKHAQATEATIQLLIDSDSAQLIAEDNGIGFSVEQSQKTKGMGIKNIRQRVSLMKGELYISSNRGNTTYIIDIPINK
ncbi:MAG: sensor histidine kinase [Flavobacteriaceae bacterium]